MNFQFGKDPSGISGSIGPPHFDGVDFDSSDAATSDDVVDFQGTFYFWERRAAGTMRPRFGPDTGGVVRYRYVRKDLSLVASGLQVLGVPPEPTKWEGHQRTVVLQYGINEKVFADSKTAGKSDVDALTDAKLTVTLSVQIESLTVKRDTQHKVYPSAWMWTITAKVTGDPVYSSGWGDLPAAPTLNKTDVRQYEQTFIQRDPEALQETAQVTVDWWGAAVTSYNGLGQRLLDKIADLAAPAGMKKRPGTIHQEAPDGGTMILTFGLTSTKDDIENQSRQLKDPAGLFDTATLYVVQNSSAYAPPAAPLGKLISQDIQKRNDGKWVGIYGYGSTDNKDKIELPESVIDDDQSDLGDTDTIDRQNGNRAPPATPTPRIADLQLVRITSVRLGGTPEVWKHRFFFARNTPLNQIEVEGTDTATDVDHIGDGASISKVTNSSTPPATPAAPIGQLIKTDTRPYVVANGSFSGFWVHRFVYGPTTNLQQIEFEGGVTVDPSTLNDGEIVTRTSSSSAPPSLAANDTNLKLIRRVSSRFQGTPEKWKHVATYGRNTGKDDLELGGTGTRVDPDTFEESATIGVLNGSATPPATPSAPTGQLIGTDIKPLKIANVGFTGLWLITFIFGPTTRKQAIEQEGEVVNDVSDIEDEDVQTVTSNSSTPPATPAARISGQVLVSIRSRKLQNTPEIWRHVFTFGWKTIKEQIEFDGTTAEANAVDLYTRVTHSVIDWTGTAAALADSLRGNNTTDPTFVSASARRRNEQKADQIIRTSGRDKILTMGGARELMWPFRGRPTGGFGSPNAEILVDVNGIVVGGFGGFFGGRAMSAYRSRRTGSMILERRFALTTSEIAAKRFVAQEGTVNQTVFFDFPANNVKFIRALGEFNYSYSGKRPVVFRYLFQLDSEMFINDGYLPDSGSKISTGGFPLLASSGFYPATYFSAFFILLWPSATDFSVFLAP